ncbi:MAG: glycosyl hydrolase [Candidatus Woesebacteria bacterium]|jgi:hypothetical protein
MLRKKRHSKQKIKTIFAGFFLLIFTVVILIGVSQLKIVREFLGKALGVPANLLVDTQGVIGSIPRPWRYLAQGGEDHDWRIEPISSQVKSLNPQYIRIDHIYDFYDIVKGSPGNLQFDFSKFNLILDDILATGAKPYIALSYMPPAIASGDIVSKPVNWADWQLTIQKTIEHVSGTKQIDNVYYEVWNEPDLFGSWKYYGDKNYLDLYTYAVRGANNAQGVKPFKIGGPAITALYKNWFDAMAKHAVKNNLRYDFFSWHRYSNDLDQYVKDMGNVKNWILKYPKLEPSLEFHITEWGHNSEIDPGYDNNYAAAHTVAGLIVMLDSIQKAFVFEIQDGKGAEGQEYWGRWGMFTHRDFASKAKPRYQALKMLDRIADQRLQITGNGSWVKALAAKDKNNNTQLVIANFDKKGQHAEFVPITFYNINPGSYTLSIQMIGGVNNVQKLATSAAVLKTHVNMPANSVGFLELHKD